jgi:hypothetical protein
VVQADPMNPMLKGPRAKRLKVKSHELLSSFAFKFNLCRYVTVGTGRDAYKMAIMRHLEAGDYTAPRFGCTCALLSATLVHFSCTFCGPSWVI